MAGRLSGAGLDNWWQLGNALADHAAATAGVALPPDSHRRLVEMVVDLAALVSCWPARPRPASPLRYLRVHRDRTARHIPWLYELPAPTRKLLTGTDRLPSLLVFAVVDADSSPALRRTWQAGLTALVNDTEATHLPSRAER